MEPKTSSITQLLNTVGDPSERANQLWELVYPELRRRARAIFRNERADHTLSSTAVLNETYIRLSTQGPREWADRSHFYATASGIMRNVLIDHARARVASKRGGGATKFSLDESIFPSVDANNEGFVVAAEALDELATTHERASLVVALRVFGGLTVKEVASEVGTSERTVKADWMIARVRLREILKL
jgi:RNA polymerase sigma factor (TIGR02999 family)